jgi:hypothetical protein
MNRMRRQDEVLPPGGLGEQAGAVRLIGAIKNTAGDMGQALVGQHDEPREIMLEVPKLALVLNQVAQDHGVLRDDGSWGNKRQFHHTPPGPRQHVRSGPRVACGSWHGKSQQSTLYMLYRKYLISEINIHMAKKEPSLSF